MILPSDRVVAQVLVRAKVWRVEPPGKDLFRCARIKPVHAKALYDRMVKRQARDGLHHAPCCPGNEWSGAALVFQRCTCGAERMARASVARQHQDPSHD